MTPIPVDAAVTADPLVTADPGAADPGAAVADPRQSLPLLFRNLRSSPDGLTAREAARRAFVYRPNELSSRGGRRWPRELLAQVTHPLALLLAAAAVLAVPATPVRHRSPHCGSTRAPRSLSLHRLGGR